MAKDLARQLAEEMKRKKEEQERLDAAKKQHPHLPVASLPNDTAQYSTAIDTSVVGDNRQTLKMRNFMNPYNQAERGFTGQNGANYFGANPNIPSLKYGFTGNTDATDLMASYAELGGMAKKLFDYGRTGKTDYQLQSYMDALASGEMANRLGINDPGVAYALSADAMNKANSAIAAGQKTKPHDLVSTYVDENAGKGYSVTNQAGDLHDFRGDVLKNAEIKKKNVQEGLYNNDELLQAGEYDLLSPDYMDMIIKDYPAKIEELGLMIDAAKSERTPYEQHWNKPWFRDLHESQTLGLPLEPEDMYQFAATMYPGETYVRADFEEYGDPEAIARVTQDVASMVATHGKGGWEEARSNKVKQLEAQRDSLQMVLDDTKAARGRQQEISGFAQKYANGDTAFHPESFLEQGAAFDISDRLLYINLMGNPDGTWQKDAAALMGREHLGTNNYDLEALNFLDPEEVGYINAEWNANHDADEVERMIDLYAPILYARQREALEAQEAYAADKYGMAYDIYNNTINTLATSAEGLRNFGASLVGVEGIDDPNSPYYNASNKSEFGHQWRATQAETSLPGFGEKLYGIPTGVLREGTKLGVSSLLGGAMGGLGFVDDAAKAAARAYEAASGVEALGSGLKEGYERGYGKFAPLYAAGSAAMAGATEHIGVDNLFKGSGKWWKTMGATGASESIEELANMAGEGMLESAFDAASGRKFSDNDRLFLQTYMETGSVDEAEAAVAKANREEAATTAVTSFGIGALLGAPAAYQESSAMRKTGKSVSSNSNSGALMDVAMAMDEGSDARQLAETLKAQSDKGKKPSNGQLGRLYATVAKDLDAKSAAVVTQTMQDAIVDEMVDKGENEEVARRAAPILAKQLRGEKLTKADTSALVESTTATTMMEELNKYTEGGKEDGPVAGLFKRKSKDTQATNEQIQAVEDMLVERGDSAKAAKRAAPLLARLANGDTLTKAEQAFVDQTEGSEEIVSKLRSEKTGNKPLQRPAWVDDVETRQAVYAAPKAEEIATKGKALLDTTRPSNQTAIAKSADKAKALTVKDGAAKDGVRDTTAVPLGSKESVDIQRIEADNDGVLKLVTKDSAGNESKSSYQTLSFKGGSVGHVVTHAVDNYAGNAEMANLMYQGYTGGDSTQYIAEMDAAYRAGFDASTVNRDSMTQYKGAAKEAFALGQKQAQEAEQTRLKNIGKAKLGKGRVTIPASVNETKLSKQQRNQVAIVRRIAEATGINFTFFESQADATGMYKAENGSYDGSTNSIRLDLNAGKNFKGDIAEYAIVRTAAHEMTHFIEANSSENYAKMRQYIADELARKGLNFNTLVQQKIDRSPVPLTRGGAIAEVVADGCEMMLKDSEAIQRLMQKDASLGQQIKNVLKEFVNRIRKAFEDIRPGSIEAQALMDEVDGVLKYADELQKMWDAGLEEAVEATRGDGLNENGVIVESKTAYANPQLSVRTWNASSYVQERDTMAKELAAKTGVTVSKATKWLDDVNSIASLVLSDPLRLDYVSSEFGSSFKSNPEYGGSVDMSTLCPKRRLATGTLDAIQDRLGDVALTRDDFLRLRAMMAERGHEVACGLCFVESSRANLSKYNKQFIDLYNATHTDQEPVTMGELNTIDGLESIRSERPDVYAEYEKFMNKLAQRKPKLFEKRTEYDGEILKKFRKDTSVDAKNRNGGLRLQSFSDFELVHLIDMMQVITDMASVGLAGQAYTKVPDFAWALGNTGLKINLSLIAKGVDENGKLIFNDIEGMNHVEAKKLRDAYSKNVGTILVTFTDEQLIAAMQDDFVDFIIPFHRSQWKKTDYRILGLPEGTKDYTLHQNEKLGRKRVKENFMPNEYWDFTISGKENAQVYLDMCNAEGRTPKFAKFLQKNADGTYSLKDDGSTDGYWKLLIDFKMYDNDGNGSKQLPVQPNFNMEQAARMLNEYKGGHETLPVAWDVVDDFVAEYQGKKGVQSQAMELSDAHTQFSVRTKEPPKKVGIAYKVFYQKNGKLYPPMVANPGGADTPVGVWLDADIGVSAPPSKTGRLQVKAGGKGTQGGSGSLAFRPGWHLGDIPKATQFDRKNPANGVKELFPKDFVWAECEYAMDVDYQEEAMSYGYTENGKFRHSYAGLPRLPEDGYYHYRTNPDPKTVPWVITGAMKVTRILSREDVDAILAENGVEPTKWQGEDGEMEMTGVGGNNNAVQYQVRYVNSKPVVWANDNVLTHKPEGQGEKEYIADYLRTHINEVYSIAESGSKVYIGEDMPGEYVYSKYSNYISKHRERLFDAKMRVSPYAGELIEIASNRRWEKTKHTHNKDAKYGVYKYETRFAFQVGGGSVRAYTGDLVILNSSDGKKYLYDIVNIKKDTTLENALQEKARQQGASTLQRASGVYDASVPQEPTTVNTEQQFSLRTTAPATTRDYLLSLTDADLSTDGEKDAMNRYRSMVDELRELEEKRAAQQEIAATATGDDRIKAKNRADIYTVQIDRLNDRIRGKENTNVLRPIVAEAKAILEANRQLEIGRPVETVIKGMGGKVRDAEAKLNRFREKVKQERDAREKITASRRHITKMVKYLDTLRRKESDYKHVPEELKPTVNALVSAFAEHSSMVFDSKRAERIAQAYSKLQDLDNDLAAYYDPDVQARIEYIADLMELKRGKPMTLAEMEIIEDVVGAIYKMVRGSNEAFFENQMMDITQIAADVADEMLQRKDKAYLVNSKHEDALDTLIRNGNLTPVYYFDNLNNSMLKRLGYDILGGQDKYGLYQRDDRVTMSEIRKQYNYNSWRNDKPIVHNDVQFTKEQALWVYATAKREATNELAQTHHLDEGGIVFEGGEVVGADGKKRKRTTPMRLSAKDVQAITSTLTEEQKGYADAVVQHLSTTVGERGNEVSMRMYGFRKYREQYYFPYKTASDQRHQTSVSNAVSATNDARLKHQSFSNPLKKGANTPLVIGDFTEMATSHMNAMNTYAAMVIPVENMNRVLNRKTEIDGAVTTLRGLMAQKYGDSTKRYLETLLKDLNGGAQVDNRTGGLIDKTVGLYKKGAVVASASVVLQQWTSIFRAAYMINPKYLAGATFRKRDWDELVKYSGVATIKDMGRFDVNVGVGGSNWLAADADDFNTWEKAKQMLNPRDWETFKTRWDDAVNFLPGWADRVTWAQIWNAVKAEQAELNPGMDKTSDAFLKKCAERFNDIINHTQVYDSTMTRSQLMRSKGALDKMATAFGSEPTMILNMVYDAIHNPAYKGKRKGKIGAGIATVTLSQLAAAAMQALASAWRKDDDERKALEKFLDKWSYNFADNINPFTMFPYMRDVWDTFATSYDVERSDMALFSELKDAISKLNNDSYSPYRKVEELAGTLAKFAGIPLKNIMRDLRSAYNAILKTDWSVPKASSIGYTLLDNLPFRDSSKTAYYQRMENAYAIGDEERAEDIAQYLEGNGTTADAVSDKLSGMLKSMLAAGNDAAVDAILADMAARGRERNGSDLRSIINNLYKNGEIDWQQAERLYKKHTTLTNANDLYWHKADLDYKGEGNFSAYRAARDALLAGDKKTYLSEKSKLLTHGKKGSSVMSETVTDLKDELLALYETDITAARQLREMIVWAYMECGKTKDSANKIIDGWFKD